MLYRPLTGPKINRLAGPHSGPEKPESKSKSVPRACTSWLARSKDERDDGKGSDDRERLCRAGGRVEEAAVGGPSAHHRAHRRGALAWRPFGERGVSRREGRAVA